ncbi:MAG: 50S ribosomal protein L29 [Lentisphaerae bacterium]|nr:50S ribosomal protein L29 [Lentisphaerota bacterium]MCP4102106.1 50S ribosomal protein L29 [Lentisphaerota bacterium]
MKMKKIKEMTDAELGAQIEELHKEQLNLKIQSRTGQLEKTARVREVRKDIARIKTEQKCRLAQASA